MSENNLPEGNNTGWLWLIGLAIVGGAVCLALAGSVLLAGAAGQLLNRRVSTAGPSPIPPTLSQPAPTVGPVRLTPFATPTSSFSYAPATAQAAAAWPTLLSSNFDLNSDGWPVGLVDDPATGTINRQFREGKYNWQIVSTSSGAWYASPQMPDISDFSLTVEAEQTSGLQVAYAIIFRQTDGDNFYSFDVAPESQSFLFSSMQAGNWVGPDGYTYSPAVHPSGPNRIAVLALGSHFSFYINNQFVAEYDDNALKTGKVGLRVIVRQAANDTVLTYDNFEVHLPVLPPTAIATPASTVTEAPLAPGKIAFAKGGAIFTIDSDGTNVVQLAFGSDPSWSPDGTEIAFSDGAVTSQIFIMGADGSHITQVTSTRFNETYPAWSPDGQQLAFVSTQNGQTDIFVMDRAGSQRRQLTNDLNNDTLPAWSPDGKQIAYSVLEDGHYTLNIINVDGSHPRRLTNPADEAIDPAWSPDGTQLVFSAQRAGNSEIFVMDVDGRNIRQLTHNSVLDIDPSWSPDGQYIAFVSKQDYWRDLYIMKADGSQVTHLAQAFANVENPVWQP